MVLYRDTETRFASRKGIIILLDTYCEALNMFGLRIFLEFSEGVLGR
jgi:hypothetical protein